ncbi:hypothetical protein GPZ77_34555 (plasmid) [Streptomyces sp. QHH-9511]|uniref:hypothetical protein n=1 Tax=Streptomyces sp. QHH-9511 TaxID=2684468 RepID=UPI001318BF85|nr:hypothetical protein [Streptomyces sp. QHH-9511]QGZ53354.1 hypothetical protein GPZ77_34555 [Streptomyces sp. QHH-9511]
MSTDPNRMTGADWIAESRHAYCIAMAARMETARAEATARGDRDAARRRDLLRTLFTAETRNIVTGEPKRIVPDEEAVRLRVAEDEERASQEHAAYLAAARKRLGLDPPRANPSAYRPYRGGLPTLGKHR